MNKRTTMISFSQFEEDVVLLMALQGVDYKDIFYIDVGANDAIWSSVTFQFYLFGIPFGRKGRSFQLLL